MPKPVDEDALIAAYLKRKRPTRAENESPDVDAVMNEYRREGNVILCLDAPRFRKFRVNGRETITRAELVRRANVPRTRRGVRLWRTEIVVWSRKKEKKPKNRGNIKRMQILSALTVSARIWREKNGGEELPDLEGADRAEAKRDRST